MKPDRQQIRPASGATQRRKTAVGADDQGSQTGPQPARELILAPGAAIRVEGSPGMMGV